MEPALSGGNGHTVVLTFARAPRRVVSLVPSMTESLIDLGAADAVVGITDYCPIPPGRESAVARVGGTKSPRVEDILALAPDLVIANQEENSQASVEALEAGDLKVWVTFPRRIDDALRILWTLIELFRIPRAGARVKTLEVTLEWARRAAGSTPGVRVFCPIWASDTTGSTPWWMTFNRDTYAHDVLQVAGGANVFADRSRRYPLDADLGAASAEDPGVRDTRYPRVTAEEVLQAAPDLILLPSEPYAFHEEDGARLRSLLAETPAVRNGRVLPVDGSLLTWHGTRLARALVELPSVVQTGLQEG
jgi:ABC-type Fe3+-hydroxamate transport system substrate-binding protein